VIRQAWVVLAWGATAVLAAPAVHAATSYYISDCQPGAVVGCKPGNDANSGTSPEQAWRSTARARDAAKKLGPGDKILFARGGAWKQAALVVTLGTQNSNDNPVWIDSYKTAWSVNVRPILPLAPGAKAVVTLSSGNRGQSAAGGIVRNLEFRGVDGKGVGVLIGDGVSDVVMDRLVVRGFAVGVQCAASSKRIRLLTSELIDNREQGVRWDCTDSRMEGVGLEGNGDGKRVQRSSSADETSEPQLSASGVDVTAPAAPTGFTVQ
jgi:hypothetical protein